MAKKEVKENKKNKPTKQKSHYFKDMKAELKKVIWPTPKQVLNSTVAVIVFTLIIAVIVFILDLCFDAINTYGITALQEKVQTSYSESQESSEEDTDSEESTEDTTEEDSDTTDEDDTESSTSSSDEDSETIEVEVE